MPQVLPRAACRLRALHVHPGWLLCLLHLPVQVASTSTAKSVDPSSWQVSNTLGEEMLAGRLLQVFSWPVLVASLMVTT